MNRPTRVLVADDAPDIRALVRFALGDSGNYDLVAEACDGQEAIDQAATIRPDLVLLDLSMPSMDGLEALPLILAAAPEVAVVVLSGLAESIAGDAARVAGAIGYIEKDDLIGSLVVMLDAILRTSAA